MGLQRYAFVREKTRPAILLARPSTNPRATRTGHFAPGTQEKIDLDQEGVGKRIQIRR